MTIRAEFTAHRGAFELTAAFSVADGETVAVLGPNGSGKSTLLHCLTGLVPIDSGAIEFGDEVVDDVESGTFVPVEERRLGIVFQDYLLFDHLTVEQNVAFGMKARRLDSDHIASRVAELLVALDIADLAKTSIRRLSGGQAQRVALARALAIEPVALLMDEPMAALDVATRRRVRRTLRTHLAAYRGPRVLVTHDPLDAYALADRVIVLEDGRITHDGTIAEITARPRSPYVAELVGTNLVRGVARDTTLSLPSGAVLRLADRHDGDVVATVRPQAIVLSRSLDTESSARNAWRLRIDGIEIVTERARVSLVGSIELTAEITVDALRSLDLRPGDDVVASVKATDIDVFAR